MPPAHKAEPLAVYLHWPYCGRICPYCDFNVHLDKRAGEAERLVQAMVADLSHWRSWTGARRIGSVHFGGGTPSLLTETQLSVLLGAIDNLWGLPTGTEIALEANPKDITDMRARMWQHAGLNRLSVGVQSFDDAVLTRLGRDHDGAAAHGALQRAIENIGSVSADLIFGVRGEDGGRLEADLDRLLDLGVGHISTYQLTIEPGTAFAKAEARGARLAIGEEASADAFQAIRARLTTAGFVHYEVSNFAKPGQKSAHNLAYWRGRDYVGVGPGAHGRLWTQDGRIATETALRPQAYAESVAETGSGVSRRETLGRDAAVAEYAMMGLRIDEGVSLHRLEQMRGQAVRIDPILIEDGFLRIENDRLVVTSSGRMVLDAVTRALLT
ncbi:radical SAM family heme chaperone HemW [uncultured Algimonas sp.]|uniref:radical SAM family heme chaperone HemW n=1 Tax=uncultured Algimonas sp. TaxID=1547920 RepID=UPI002624C31C|nr:radical SAM family heme chaperone HemW [uncultured Algimonas sp.]